MCSFISKTNILVCIQGANYDWSDLSEVTDPNICPHALCLVDVKTKSCC